MNKIKLVEGTHYRRRQITTRYGLSDVYHLGNVGGVVTYHFSIASKLLGSSVSRTPVVNVERCIGLFATAATVGIIVANANADVDDACSDVDASA